MNQPEKPETPKQATWLLEKGVDIVTVSQLLGHTSLTTTQIYCVSSTKAKHDGVAQLDPQKSAHSTGNLARMWPVFQKESVTKHSSKYRHRWN